EARRGHLLMENLGDAIAQHRHAEGVAHRDADEIVDPAVPVAASVEPDPHPGEDEGEAHHCRGLDPIEQLVAATALSEGDGLAQTQDRFAEPRRELAPELKRPGRRPTQTGDEAERATGGEENEISGNAAK